MQGPLQFNSIVLKQTWLFSGVGQTWEHDAEPASQNLPLRESRCQNPAVPLPVIQETSYASDPPPGTALGPENGAVTRGPTARYPPALTVRGPVKAPTMPPAIWPPVCPPLVCTLAHSSRNPGTGHGWGVEFHAPYGAQAVTCTGEVRGSADAEALMGWGKRGPCRRTSRVQEKPGGQRGAAWGNPWSLPCTSSQSGKRNKGSLGSGLRPRHQSPSCATVKPSSLTFTVCVSSRLPEVQAAWSML